LGDKEKMNEQEREILARFSKKRSNLIPILQKLQETEKYISQELISEVGQYLDISENDIYSVAGFYPGFRFIAPGEHRISVCLCLACRLKGGNDILLALEKELGISAGQTTGDTKFSLDRITLSGCSGSSPVVMVDKAIVDNMTPDKVKELLSKYR
jgi:NADH-quinone oxidoreductase subunit E